MRARMTERRHPSFRLKVLERGTCRPLQVDCRMHPEGTPTIEKGVMESPHVVRVIISAKEPIFNTLLLLYTVFLTTILL